MTIRVQFQGLICHVLETGVAVFLRGPASEPHAPKLIVNKNALVGTPTFPALPPRKNDNVYSLKDFTVMMIAVKEEIAADDPSIAFKLHVPKLDSLAGPSPLSDDVIQRKIGPNFSGFLIRPHGQWFVPDYFRKQGFFDDDPTKTPRCFPRIVEIRYAPADLTKPIGFTTNPADPSAGKSLFVEDGALVTIVNEADASGEHFHAHYSVLKNPKKKPIPVDVSSADCPFSSPPTGAPVVGVQCSNTQYP